MAALHRGSTAYVAAVDVRAAAAAGPLIFCISPAPVAWLALLDLD